MRRIRWFYGLFAHHCVDARSVGVFALARQFIDIVLALDTDPSKQTLMIDLQPGIPNVPRERMHAFQKAAVDIVAAVEKAMHAIGAGVVEQKNFRRPDPKMEPELRKPK